MLAVYASSLDRNDPLSGLTVGEQPEPDPPPGWTTVTVKAASLNHHDLWSLRGVGLAEEQLPMILGCDAAGVAEDGTEVVVYPVVGGLDDTDRTLLSEKWPGSLADRVRVPRGNLVPKPAELSFAAA